MDIQSIPDYFYTDGDKYLHIPNPDYPAICYCGLYMPSPDSYSEDDGINKELICPECKRLAEKEDH